MATQLSKKRKFVADGVFFAELNEVLMRELAEDGYSGVEVRVTPMRTEIIIRATRTQNVLGRFLTFYFTGMSKLEDVTSKGETKGVTIPLASLAEKEENRTMEEMLEIFNRESEKWDAASNLLINELDNILEVEDEDRKVADQLVIISGKLRAQRAKSMKFKDGYMISSGQPVKEYIDSAVRHVLLRQGVLGIKVKIMLDWDPTGKVGPKTPLPDNVVIHMPKDDVVVHPPKEVEEYVPHVAEEPLPMAISAPV
nr:40S ribosomal protein S3-1-like [Tanacetum cinerariifolium]